jgi:class 3 adenylate cyclase/uncharacterized protein YggT (Ycf19 family)
MVADKIDPPVKKEPKKERHGLLASNLIVARTFYWILSVINFLLTLLVILYLLVFAIQFIPNAENYVAVQKVLQYTQPSLNYTASIVPTQFKGHNYAAIVIAVVILIAKFILNWLMQFLVTMMNTIKRKRRQALAPPTQSPTEATRIGEEPKARTTLLKQWIDIKEKLEKSKRLLCFLSVDIIGSTSMKEGEDPHIIEYTFAEYKKFVEELLNTNNVWKVAWTPDGLMSAFLTPDEAIKAGKEIIIGLDAFNKYVNQLKTPFRVRCGINYGKVVFDIKARMEEVTDRVIDIAGHLQKSAEPDTIWIAKEVLEYIAAKEEEGGFKQIQVKVDDHEVVEWKKP